MKTLLTFLLLLAFSLRSYSQCTPPSATITPDGPTSFCIGGSVTLNANTGVGLTYQWQYNNVDISGATSSSLFVTEGGDYIVVVSNSCGSSSNAITILVRTPPTAVLTADGPTTFCEPGSVTLNADAGNANPGVPVGYQWRVNAIGISGATTSSYVATSSGDYDCIVANYCGNTFSNIITVTTYTTPSGSITASGPTTFCSWGYNILTASPGQGNSYQWKDQGNDIAGATSITYEAHVSGSYTCQIYNNCFSVLSNTIVITVIPVPAPVITASGTTHYCIGGSVTLSCNPEPPDAGFSYQWYVNGGSPISGQTNSSTVVTGSGGIYTCRVSNVCATVESNGIDVVVSQIIPPTPSMIVGNTKPCPFTTEVYSVDVIPYPDVVFNWTLPPGASIISGAGTNVITVNYSSTTNGTMSVTASSPCGTSNARTKKIGKNQHCGARLSDSFDSEQLDVMIYPNPANEQFNLIIKNDISIGSKLIVHDLAGRIVEQLENIGSGVSVEFGNRLDAGIYLVEIISSGQRKMIRVTKSD